MTAPGPAAVGPSRLNAFLLALILAGLALRIAAAVRPGLWADEIFSLAMATGHSLEHPAAEADPAHGDFVEPAGARPPQWFRRYAEHDERSAGAGRVIRAVRLSDTNPPLYYLLLNPWTLVFGTGDAALRLFSVLWAGLSLPLLWLLGRRLGGASAGWSACLLFCFAPVALYYSYEGRMYSLLWFLALALAWLSVGLVGDQPVRGRRAALWVLAGAAGLLTHYFFGFVWLAVTGWLLVRGPGTRDRLALAAGLTGVLVLPWYLEVPASLARWRVSGGWLDGELAWPGALGRPLALAGELLSGRSYLGGWDHAGVALAALLLLLVLALARQRALRELFTADRALPWTWLAAACTGPLVFDLLRHTTTSEVHRYALAGLPAAVLLAAIALSRLRPRLHVGLLAATLLVWLPGARRAALAGVSRPSQPYRQLDARLEAGSGPGDLLLVSSIPSGVIGVARYLERDLPMLSWVPGLGNREAERDLPGLVAGHRRVALVKVTRLGASAPAEGWLRRHARPLGEVRFPRSRAELLFFGPLEGRAVFPGGAE